MDQSGMPLRLAVYESDESSGHCDCCGSVSRCVWGWIDNGEATVAAYWVRWTEDNIHIDAAIDLCIGSWGDDAPPSDRTFVSLLHRRDENGGGAIMVIDAGELTPERAALADNALRREDVVGTPLAENVFALVDAILLQDRRLARPQV